MAAADEECPAIATPGKKFLETAFNNRIIPSLLGKL